MKPNPNLWAVDVVDRKTGAVHIALFVCAPTAGSASSKAKRLLAKLRAALPDAVSGRVRQRTADIIEELAGYLDGSNASSNQSATRCAPRRR